MAWNLQNNLIELLFTSERFFYPCLLCPSIPKPNKENVFLIFRREGFWFWTILKRPKLFVSRTGSVNNAFKNAENTLNGKTFFSG